MANEIVMPTLGLTMTAGTVTDILVKEGDTVSKGDALASISSEKLSADVESPVDGIVLKIIANIGDEIPIKKPIMYVGQAGEQVDEPSAQASETAEIQVAGKEKEQPEPVQPANKGSRLFATPLARKISQQKNYDLSLINGTGGNGRITRRDVERYVPAIATTPQAVQNVGSGLTGMRKTIAQRMMNSKQSTATVTLHRKADVSALMAFRKQVQENIAAGIAKEQYSLNAFLTRAVVLALRETPAMNAWYANGEYVPVEAVHIGMAVAVDDGLVVPVIRDAQNKSIAELGQSIASVAKKSRNGTLPGDAYSGSTFSITNLGPSQIEYFTPIINAPEIGILGVGTIMDELGFDAEQTVVARKKLGLSLTFDHQIIDGSPAADFLGKIVSLLEDPYRLVL